MSNLALFCLGVVLVMQFIMLLYGRYQYLRGLIKGREDGDFYSITEDSYNNYGESKYSKGYNNGFIDGLNKLEYLSESWSSGWIEEAEGWREIMKDIVRTSVGIKKDEKSLSDSEN